MYVASNTNRAMFTILSLLLIVGVAGGQVILDMPSVKEVELPSLLQDAYLAEGSTCRQGCSAVHAGLGKPMVDGASSFDPLSLQILELRRGLGDEFCLDSCKFILEGEATTFRDSRVNAAGFLSALDTVLETVAESDRTIGCPEVQGPSVMSENQAATLRYAADRAEQVAATLERADLAEQAAAARSLAEAVLASPARRDSVARPAQATFLR